MPIQHAIWKVGSKPTALSASRLLSEQQLEEMIVADVDVLSNEWMLIGRQETTSHGGRVDLLAIAPDCSLVLVELKRDRTPREIVAQALDYASWVQSLTAEKIVQIYQRFTDGKDLNDAFRERFGIEIDEDNLNESHQIIIVAAELDAATERIIGYLNERDVAINVVFFQVFQNGQEQLLSRVWLIDPAETQSNVASKGKSAGEKEPWNGEYYVSYGGSNRSWEDARKYGYISGGGGRWYSQTLKLLTPGDRVWVKIPKTGFVGVGRVIETMRPIAEFTVSTEHGEKPLLDVMQNAAVFKERAKDADQSDYCVRVKWLDSVAEKNAVNEAGLFGNQNTVCQPQTPKWRHTVDRLKSHFKKWDQ